MKNIMKKIAMMGMLSCIASSNTYTKSYDQNSKSGNLIAEPINEKYVQQVNIKVYNLPENTFIAAGASYYAYDGKTNYVMQTPNADGSYTFDSNCFYAAAANDRKSFKNQHKGSEFLGKTTWDVTANIIN